MKFEHINAHTVYTVAWFILDPKVRVQPVHAFIGGKFLLKYLSLHIVETKSLFKIETMATINL
jgi:hypothetical protein